MIDLYACGSPNVLKVIFMLSETALPYTLHEVDMGAGEQYAPEFVALNPNSKLPVIVDRDGPQGRPHTVFESGAILLYLAEKAQLLLPIDAEARSRALQWLMWQMASVGPMFGQALHFRYIAPQDIPYARGRYLREVNRLYDVLEARRSSSRIRAAPRARSCRALRSTASRPTPSCRSRRSPPASCRSARRCRRAGDRPRRRHRRCCAGSATYAARWRTCAYGRGRGRGRGTDAPTSRSSSAISSALPSAERSH
jgi:GST-like protein